MNSNPQSLWHKLQQQNLVKDDMPSASFGEEQIQSGWTIRVMQGFAGWIAAIFLLAFFGSVFGWLFRDETAVVLTSFGLIGCSLSYCGFRVAKHNDFLNQIALVFNLAGQFMFAFGLFDLLDSRKVSYFLVLFVFQSSLVFLIPNYISRLLSTWFSLIALFFAFNGLGIYGLSPAAVAALLAMLWMNDLNWGKYRSLWEPVGYGLAISLLHFNGQLIFGFDLNWLFGKAPLEGLENVIQLLRFSLLSIALIWVVYKVLQQNKMLNRSKRILLVWAGSILLLVAGYFIQGLSAALLLLLVGFAVQRKVLIAIGVVACLTFLSWYYYQLELTLLTKSVILMSFGASLLLMLFVINRQGNKTNKSMSELVGGLRMSKPKWIGLVSMITVLLLVNGNIYQKEQVLKNGQSVLLKLAPVDPRSLMQGDYMRLRFEIETRLSDNEKELTKGQASKYFVVELNKHSEAKFSHFYNGEALLDNQIKMQYRIRKGRIHLATHAFFFQEGTASQYESAKYGEFRVAKNGELLLNSLRDESFNVMGLNRPNN